MWIQNQIVTVNDIPKLLLSILAQGYSEWLLLLPRCGEMRLKVPGYQGVLSSTFFSGKESPGEASWGCGGKAARQPFDWVPFAFPVGRTNPGSGMSWSKLNRLNGPWNLQGVSEHIVSLF